MPVEQQRSGTNNRHRFNAVECATDLVFAKLAAKAAKRKRTKQTTTSDIMLKQTRAQQTKLVV